MARAKKTAGTSRCNVGVKAGDPALPVAGTGELSHLRKSRNSRRRALVLLAVHLIIAAHIAHFVIAGRTLSPVEPSESMYTLELRQLNAGFIFLAVALLGTLLFGRFFCGWGCHIVALQDMCGWMMKKLGVRPRPFRSRLLLWGPAVVAFYMFFWPNIKRWIVMPLLIDQGWVDAASLAPIPGLSNHLMTDAFWKTFPGPVFAVLTFATCGFAAVYFLGAKGFCSYGCPYGGLFAAVERMAPWRIVVDDNCEQCGHCTATCTSNVLVHEEVRRYGMVVDPGCMRCMDCVSVCPKNALSFGRARPSLFKGPPRDLRQVNRYPLGWGEELLAALIGVGAFWAFHRLYDGPPLLMSAGLGAITGFCALKLWQMLRQKNVRLQNLKLKLGGKPQRAGWVFAAAATLWLAFTSHSAFAQWHRTWGDYHLQRTEVSRLDGLAGNFDPQRQSEKHRRATDRALRHLQLADRWALVDVPKVKLNLAWARLLGADVEGSVAAVRQALALAPDQRNVHADLVQMLLTRGRIEEAAEAMDRMLQSVEPTPEELFRFAGLLVQAGRHDDAVERYRASADLAEDPATRYNLGGLLRRLGRNAEAATELERAAELAPNDPDTRVELGLAYAELGRNADAIEAFREAIRLAPDSPESRLHLPKLIEDLESRIGS